MVATEIAATLLPDNELVLEMTAWKSRVLARKELQQHREDPNDVFHLVKEEERARSLATRSSQVVADLAEDLLDDLLILAERSAHVS